MLALFAGIFVFAGFLLYFVVLPLQALFWISTVWNAPECPEGPNRDLWYKHATQALKRFWGGTLRDNEEFLNELGVPMEQFDTEDAYIEAVVRETIAYRHRQKGGNGNGDRQHV